MLAVLSPACAEEHLHHACTGRDTSLNLARMLGCVKWLRCSRHTKV